MKIENVKKIICDNFDAKDISTNYIRDFLEEFQADLDGVAHILVKREFISISYKESELSVQVIWLDREEGSNWLEILKKDIDNIKKGLMRCTQCGRWFDPKEESYQISGFAGVACSNCSPTIIDFFD